MQRNATQMNIEIVWYDNSIQMNIYIYLVSCFLDSHVLHYYRPPEGGRLII